jgi:hypothetical protein
MMINVEKRLLYQTNYESENEYNAKLFKYASLLKTPNLLLFAR